MAALGARFHIAKDEVNAELAVFAGDLVGVLEDNTDMDPGHQERVEDLLVLARECALMDPQVFRRQCEAIVQDLDDKRQELPMGVLKRLHTRMLFILTRCTRLLQFEKENGLDEVELHKLQQQAKVGSSLESWKRIVSWKEKGKALLQVVRPQRPSLSSKPQEGSSKRVSDEVSISRTSTFSNMTEQVVESDKASISKESGGSVSPVHPVVADREPSWQHFSVAPSKELKSHGRELDVQIEMDSVVFTTLESSQSYADEGMVISRSSEDVQRIPSESTRPRISWGDRTYQPEVLDDNIGFICRICEDEVATSRLEDHSRICALADRLSP